MQCLRCKGLMVVVRMDETWGDSEASGWHCLLCGETIDSVVQANRLTRCEPVRSRARVFGSSAAGPIRRDCK